MIQTAGTPGDSPPGGQASPPPTPTATAGGPDPARLLNLGPQYVRNRYLKREPGMERRNRRSAVELLEESKSLYVKSESVRDHKQVLKLETRHHRRSTYSPPTGEAESGQHSGSRSSADATPSSPCSSSTSVTGGGGRTPPSSINQTWPVGLQPQPDSPATDHHHHQQQQQQLDQCHNVTTAVTTHAPGDTPKAPSPRLLQSEGSANPLRGGREDQVDSCGQGRGQLSDALPCSHGLLTNRPCDECLNSNTTTTSTTTSTTTATTTTSPAPTTDILHCTPRPPPPVPPKPSNEHHSLQQQQQQQQGTGGGGGGGPGPGGGVGGARQPPPVPPKRHSSISLTDNNTGSSSLSSSTNTAAQVGIVGGINNSSKAPPPVPPKPSAEDRSSVYQPDTTGAKWRPPPVPPKPSSASPTPPLSQPQLHPVQQHPLWRAANDNGMDPALPAGSGVVVVRPKSAGVDSPRSSSGSTPPPPPPPVPPKPRPSLMGSEVWREAHTDTSSEIDQHSSSSLVKVDDKLVVVRRRPRKFHRSRSDLTKRFSNSSDLSELSARFSRNSADLEKFFNEMGLDRSVLEPMMMSACQRSASDLHLFESASSVDSPDIRSWCSEDDGDHALKHEVVEERTPPGGPASIVERNARIIKWLCSVKKAASHEEPLTEQ